MLYALLVLFNLLGQLMLDQLDVIFVVGGFFSEFMFMLFHHLVEPPLSAFFLVVVSLLKSVFFCLVEGFELAQLLLGLLLNFANLCLVGSFFFFQLSF